MAQPFPILQVISPFIPNGLTQSQYSSGLSSGRVHPGCAEQTRPSPLIVIPLFSSGHLTPAQGLFLVHQLPSLKTSQCCSAMNLLYDLEEFTSSFHLQFLQLWQGKNDPYTNYGVIWGWEDNKEHRFGSHSPGFKSELYHLTGKSS